MEIFKLKALHLENFKAFGNRSVVPMAPITLVLGQNSSGKSSILQALSLLKQTMESEEPNVVLLPRTKVGYTDLGAFREMLFDHDTNRTLKIRIDFESYVLINMGRISMRQDQSTKQKGVELQYRRYSSSTDVKLERIEIFDIDIDKHSPVIGFNAVQERNAMRDMNILTEEDALFLLIGNEEYFYNTGEEAFKYMQDRILMYCTGTTKNEQFWLKLFDTVVGSHGIWVDRLMGSQDAKFFNELLQPEYDVGKAIDWVRKRVLNMPVRTNLFSPPHRLSDHPMFDYASQKKDLEELEFLPVRCLGENIVRNMSWDINKLLKNLYPLNPLLKLPLRWYAHSGFTPVGVGIRGELLPDLLYRDSDLLEKANIWLERFTGYKINVVPMSAPTESFEIRLQDLRRSGKKVSVNLFDVGHGVSQLLPFIVQCLTTQGQIISIEHPEAHIHPRLQSELGDLLTQAIKPPYENQFLIETHSEHLILRLQKLVRKGILRKDDISVIYVTRSKDGSRVQQLRMDDEGGFVDAWPDGFFPERLNELL